MFNLHYQKEIPSTDYVGNNILRIVEILSRKKPKTKIYVQTVLPTDKEFMKENIIRVNEIIKSHQKEGYFKVIDLYTQFANKKGLIKTEFTYDGTHLNNEVYNTWVDFLQTFIN